MNIFANAILVTLSLSDPFVTLQTYEPRHGRSQHFYLSKSTLLNQLGENAEGSITESDLMNFCTVSRNGDNIRFRLCWLHNGLDEELHGYHQTLIIPVTKVAQVLAGESIKLLSCHQVYSCNTQLFFTKTAHEAIAEADKLTQHALRKFFRDNFRYSCDETLIVQRDKFVRGFYFYSNITRFEGGIVLHETEVTGKDGRPHRKVYFGIHT